jgi:ribose transport system ATP-binding protein
MMSDELCFMKSICKTYGDEKVLNEVNIELHKGEIHSIIGDNGAGKSILMRILAGLEQPNSGEIYIKGQQIKSYNISQAVKLGISFISHGSILVPDMTVLDNILLGKYPKNNRIKILDKRSARDIGKDVFKLLNFSIDLNRKVGTYGTAERRLIVLAKALCCNAEILILDEAELGLNDVECMEFYKELVRLKEFGVSTFFISQRINTIIEISDRISMINEGNVVWTMSNTGENGREFYKKLFLYTHKKGYPKLCSRIGADVLKAVHLSNATALKDINFELHKGEILGITGVAGAGRTSLARCLFGMDKTCAGEIHIQQKKVSIRTPEKAISLKMGYVEEIAENGLVPEMSAIENMTLANIKGISYSKIMDLRLERSSASCFLGRLGFPKEKQTGAVKKLSTGEMQKVILSKWLFSGAKIIILDEPTNGLDVIARVELYNILTELATQGLSLLLISIDVNELAGMCDRVLILKNGMFSEEILKEQLEPINILTKIN